MKMFLLRGFAYLVGLALVGAGAYYLGSAFGGNKTRGGEAPLQASSTGDPSKAPVGRPRITPKAPLVGDRRGLVNVKQIAPGIEVELRYAMTKNPMGDSIYDEPQCLLLEATAKRLAAVNADLMRKGYRLKVWDAYRPLSAQKMLWERFRDEKRVADPSTGGCDNNRGGGVDVTLYSIKLKRDVLMPCDFMQDNAPAAITSYNAGAPAALANREVMAAAMERHGFRRDWAHWWHFTDPTADTKPALDISFADWSALPEPAAPTDAAAPTTEPQPAAVPGDNATAPAPPRGTETIPTTAVPPRATRGETPPKPGTPAPPRATRGETAPKPTTTASPRPPHGEANTKPTPVAPPRATRGGE